jgi:hypothetical protein
VTFREKLEEIKENTAARQLEFKNITDEIDRQRESGLRPVSLHDQGFRVHKDFLDSMEKYNKVLNFMMKNNHMLDSAYIDPDH